MIYTILTLLGLLFLTIVVGGLCNQVKMLREEWHAVVAASTKADVKKHQERIDQDREEQTEG